MPLNQYDQLTCDMLWIYKHLRNYYFAIHFKQIPNKAA